jgi:hypothetical protein
VSEWSPTQITFRNLVGYLIRQQKSNPGTVHDDWIAAAEAGLALQVELDQRAEERNALGGDGNGEPDCPAVGRHQDSDVEGLVQQVAHEKET